jgi:hypothetical protein
MRSISLGIDKDTDWDAPDDASDLFGYPPTRSRVCPSCGLRAEPYSGHFCWKCTMSGDARRTLGRPGLTEAERDEMSGLLDDIKAGRAGPQPKGDQR